LLALVTPSIALGVAPGQIKSFVTFGDSYTDSSYYPSADGRYQWPTCSNFLTYRPFPPIMEWQNPAYLNETYSGSLALNAQETVYTIWIGTNDLGVNALLTGNDAPGAIDVLKRLYESGARNFIVQN
ncbi:hypothetical protein OG21DRAFT_1380569, partial [Imleria badia]